MAYFVSKYIRTWVVNELLVTSWSSVLGRLLRPYSGSGNSFLIGQPYFSWFHVWREVNTGLVFNVHKVTT